jgi:glyoxylase-like metal-dependent hydrolase (beta-lactamase superfamily II)
MRAIRAIADVVKVTAFPVGPLGCNCSIVADDNAKQAIVVDPGGDFERIQGVLAESGLSVCAIVHTHTHIDHVGATAALQRWSGAGAHIHEDDRFLYDMLEVQAALLRIPHAPEKCDLTGELVDDHRLAFGAFEMRVLHTPRHTPELLVPSIPRQGIVFTGDALSPRHRPYGSLGRRLALIMVARSAPGARRRYPRRTRHSSRRRSATSSEESVSGGESPVERSTERAADRSAASPESSSGISTRL